MEARAEAPSEMCGVPGHGGEVAEEGEVVGD